MKKKIYVFMTFSNYSFDFTSSAHDTIEAAREAQMKWLEDTCKFYGLTVPTKDELMEGNNDDFFYNEDNENLCIYGSCYDEYSTINIHEIEI